MYCNTSLFKKIRRTTNCLLISLFSGAATCIGTSALTAQTTPAANSSKAEALSAALTNSRHPELFVVAHRGDWRNHPENSIPAIESCIAMGIAMVEIDVQKTKDGVLVLMHDGTVDRTTTGKGAVSHLTLAEIKQLQLKSNVKKGVVTEERVPTLEEALKVAKGRILLNLDKAHRFPKEVKALVDKYGMSRQIIMKAGIGKTSVDEFLTKNKELTQVGLFMPILNIRSIKEDRKEFITQYLKKMKPFAIEILSSVWDEEAEAIVKLCNSHGTRVWCNVMWSGHTGNFTDGRAGKEGADAVYGKLLDQGVTILQTDQPRLLQEYLDKRRKKTAP